MTTPNPAPDAGRPAGIEEDKSPSTAGPVTNPDAERDPKTTQADLAGSDGAGIRGDYGNASQTNGLEGGTESPTDAAPDRADQNPTNAAESNAAGAEL